MAEQSFVVYDGIQYKKIQGVENGNTGHFVSNIDEDEIITVLGTYLDSEANRVEFEQAFNDFINVNTTKIPRAQFNYILIGKEHLYSLNYRISTYVNNEPRAEKPFDALVFAISKIGYMNNKFSIINTNPPRMLIPLVDKKIPDKKIDMYLVPLDKQSIVFEEYNLSEEDDI